EAVARREVEVALGVDAEVAAALPDAGGAAVGGGAVHLLERQGRGVEAEHPAVIGAVVPVRGIGEINGLAAIGVGDQLERRAVVCLPGVEGQDAADAAGAGAGHGDGAGVVVVPRRVAQDERGDPVGAGGNVDGIKPLQVVGGARGGLHFLGLGEDVHRVR